MHREASMGTAQRGQQPRKPDPLTLSIPFHGNLGLSGNLLPCDVLALACLLSSPCMHPRGRGPLPRFSVGSHLAVPADGNPRTSWRLLLQVHCGVCNMGLSRAPRMSFALIMLMFTMQRPWCYCPCFTDGETKSENLSHLSKVSPRYYVAELGSSSGASWVHSRCHGSVSGAENPTLTTVTNESSEVWGLVRVFSELCIFLTQSRKLSLPWWLSGKESTCQCRR